MPAFESTQRAAGKNLIWRSAVKNRLHCSIDLFDDYWQRFNTMRVPILGEDRFLELALELEQFAKDEEDLERLLTERKRQWEVEAKEWLSTIAMKSWSNDETFQCKDASLAAYRASMTGSLQHFLELLNGVVHGWEPDEVQDKAPDTTDIANHSSKTQDTSAMAGDASEARAYDTGTQHDYEFYIQQKLASKNPVYEPTFDNNVHKAPFFKSDQAYLIREHFGGIQRERTHDGKRKTPPSSLNKDKSPNDLDNAPRPRKRVRIDDDYSTATAEDISQDVTNKGVGRVADKSRPRKRSRSDNDELSGEGQKRQKTVSSEPPAPITPATGKNTAKENIIGDKRKKRPKIQSPASSTSYQASPLAMDAVTPSTSLTASTQQSHVSTSTKVTTQSETKGRSTSSGKTNHGRKNNKQNSTSHNLDSTSPSSTRGTRASRRNKSSSLWALDSSGKPSQL